MVSGFISAASLKAALAIVLLTCLVRYAQSASKKQLPRKTFSIHPLAPSFISGFYAAYQLGTNETDFMLGLQERYGAGVYLPFPIGAHFIFSNKLVRKIYSGAYNAQLSFKPIRKKMANVLFGMGSSITALDNKLLDKHIFPLSSKGMTKPRLVKALDRYDKSIKDTVTDELHDWKGDKVIDIVDWTYTLMFKASVAALFGNELEILPLDQFQKTFKALDSVVPLLVSRLIPPSLQRYFPSQVAQGIGSRDWVNERFGKWARETGCAGLEDVDVIKAKAMEAIKLGFNDFDNGAMAFGQLWALLANSPYTVSWIVIYFIQADKQLYKDVMAEIDSVDLSTTLPSQADMPLLTGIILETLRLKSSAMSMRTAHPTNETATHLRADENDENGIFIQPGESMACVIRVGHLDQEVWGETAREWDGRRFYDDPAVDNTGSPKNSSRIPDMRAFGGGTSMCEGRYLAQAEIKCFLVHVMQSFELTLTPESFQRSQAEKPLETLISTEGVKMLAPRAAPGRTGLGVMQCDSPMYGVMSKRRRE